MRSVMSPSFTRGRKYLDLRISGRLMLVHSHRVTNVLYFFPAKESLVLIGGREAHKAIEEGRSFLRGSIQMALWTWGDRYFI